MVPFGSIPMSASQVSQAFFQSAFTGVNGTFG
jgi:hypothetical protein